MKTLLIINPTAGRRRQGVVEEITAALRQPFVDLTVHLTTGPGDATVAARRASVEGFELVVAAGGDGSINEVANGLVGSEVAMGIVPVGTENVLAKEMGVPLNPTNACQFLYEKAPRRIDTGRVGDRRFVCFAGIGFDAHVAHRLNPLRKASMGAFAYLLTSMEALGPYRREARTAELDIDGEVVNTPYWLMMVGNIRTYGGGMQPTPRASLEDGLLDICIFPQVTYPQTLTQMIHTTKGSHLDLPGMLYYQAKRIAITTTPVEQVQLDGDPFGETTPMVVEVDPSSLTVRF